MQDLLIWVLPSMYNVSSREKLGSTRPAPDHIQCGNRGSKQMPSRARAGLQKGKQQKKRLTELPLTFHKKKINLVFQN